MRDIIVAFDVDGTLIRTEKGKGDSPIPNERIRSLLIALSSFKNVKIVVWSGGGEIYARMVVAQIGLREYVDMYVSKNVIETDDGRPVFSPGFKPDIAIDDMHSCDLGDINLIVREK